MTQIQDVMTEHPVTAGELTSLAEAARVMRDGRHRRRARRRRRRTVRHPDRPRPRRRAMAEDKDPAVQAVCSTPPVTVRPDDEPDQAADLMREHALRRPPVTDGDRLVGTVTLGDVAIEQEPQSPLADISTAEANT
ncbi:CBS domain-containing protein [Streptomyces sp. NPDC050448]|uniref:CBS domain-containing protein n=1 Tax=Streptomyces sp. NPDC050448 TaxID=3155404 RepID=UPI00342B38AB